jgi:hypothetical protein
MNSLPNAGAHPGNIDVGAVKVRTAFVEPLNHGCHFATSGEEGEDVMTVIIAGIIHLGPVRVETQIIAFEPLFWITGILFDLALIHSSDRKTMGYWIMGFTVDGGLKVAIGGIRIISRIVSINPGNYLPCVFWVRAMANLQSGVKCHQPIDVGLIGQRHRDGRRIKFKRIVSCLPNKLPLGKVIYLYKWTPHKWLTKFR